MRSGVFNDDRQLVRSLLRGDERAFRAFFDRYAPLLLGFVLRRSAFDRAGAEDVVQSALLRAVRGLAGFRGEASLYTWLCQVCRSELADQRRASARRPVTVSFDQDAAIAATVASRAAAASASPDDATDIEPGEYGERVSQVLAALPENHAVVLEMKYARELSVEEIAGCLRITTTAAQSLLARARTAFRERWLANAGEST